MTMFRVCSIAFAVLTFTVAASAQDAEKGKSQFAQCRACHTVEKGQNRVGPTLFGILGRKAGTVEKYAYSQIMKEAAEKGLVWNEKNMDEYLEDPNEFLKKYVGKDSADNKMPNKFPNEALRKNVIAYLKTVQ
jgi:cytochrome c